MSSIPDYNDNELWIVRNTLRERYRQPVEPDLAEAELRLNPLSSELSSCPTLVWQDPERGANLVIFKVGERRYRCTFFYSVREQYGTGIDEYDDLTECTVTLLQVHADYEAKRAAKQEP